MKKLYLCVFIVILLVISLGLGGCNSKDASASDNMTTETTTVGEEYANTDNNEEDEELALEVLEEDSSMGDLKGFYLFKNGKFYSLRATVKNDAPVGVQTANDAGRLLYSNAVYYDKSNTWVFYSYGEIPELTLSDEAKVIAFSDTNIPTLSLYKVDFYGYGVGASLYSGNLSIYSVEASDVIQAENISDFMVREEESNNTVEDYYDLDPETVYVASWHVGTNYGEVYGKANNSVYTYMSGFDASSAARECDYRIEGKLTNSGYAEYDLSGVEPGLYSLSGSVQSSGIIKVE